MMGETNKDNVMRMNFGKEGADLSGKETYNRQLKYMSWGPKNDRPQILIDLFYSSALHQGIINGKVDKIAGKGWEIVEGDPEAIQAFLDNGINDLTLDDTAESNTLDLEMFGGFVVKIVLTNDRKSVAYLEAVEVDQSRLSKDEKVLFVSDDLFDRKEPLTPIPVYNDNREEGVYHLYFKLPFKKKKGEKGVYPKPPYEAALKDIETDKNISLFNNSEIRNFFSAGTIINIPSGVPVTPDQKKEAKEYAEKFTDPDDAGAAILNFCDGQEEAITVAHITQNNINQRYLLTQKAVHEQIITGHSITSPLIVGVKTPGQLGGGEEIETSLEAFVDSYVTKRQRIINMAYNWIMNNIADIPGKIALRKPDVKKKAEQEVQQFNSQSVDDAIGMFSELGVESPEIFMSFEVAPGTKPDDAIAIAEARTKQYFDELSELSGYKQLIAVYDLIKQGTPIEDIAEGLKLPQKEVIGIVDRLKSSGMVTEKLEPTSKGETIAKAVDVPTDQFESRFMYVKRDDVSGETIIPTSRSFCKELVRLGRAFTREEIDTVSSRVGYDVFTLRGGWYHNPRTDRNEPFCRHVWRFVLVRKQ